MMISVGMVSDLNYDISINGRVAIISVNPEQWNSLSLERQKNICREICEKNNVRIIGVRENTEGETVPINIFENDDRGGRFVK